MSSRNFPGTAEISVGRKRRNISGRPEWNSAASRGILSEQTQYTGKSHESCGKMGRRLVLRGGDSVRRRVAAVVRRRTLHLRHAGRQGVGVERPARKHVRRRRPRPGSGPQFRSRKAPPGAHRAGRSPATGISPSRSGSKALPARFRARRSPPTGRSGNPAGRFSPGRTAAGQSSSAAAKPLLNTRLPSGKSTTARGISSPSPSTPGAASRASTTTAAASPSTTSTVSDRSIPANGRCSAAATIRSTRAMPA